MEIDLQEQLNNIFGKKENYWMQKSRISWLHGEDRNTKYFHLSTIIRRRKNKLEGLFNTQNQWETENTGMKSIVANYFKDLFVANNSVGLPHYWLNIFKNIDQSTLHNLNKEVPQ